MITIRVARWLAIAAGLASLTLVLGVGSQPATADEPPTPMTYVVNSIAHPGDGTCDSTECTLSEAISAANSHPNASGQPDRIEFNIPGPGPHTIVASALTITDPLAIDGLTQPGSYCGPSSRNLIEVRGVLSGVGSGLILTASDSTIRGLALGEFAFGFYLLGNGNRIECNNFGTDGTGLVAAPNTFGALIWGDNNVIGGNTPGQRNIISGNPGPASGPAAAVVVRGNGNTISGNFVGPDATGMSAPANPGGPGVVKNITGIVLRGSSRTTIGGPAPGDGNVISGNKTAGVLLFDDSTTGTGTLPFSDDNVIEGNLIGVAADGTSPLPNATGVNIRFGGNNAVRANVIAHNTASAIGWGVLVYPAMTGNTITANSIYNNAGTPGAPGIFVMGSTWSPTISPVVGAGIISATASPGAQVTFEVFTNDACDPSGRGEGQNYLQTLVATADASGNAQANFAPEAGVLYTATATSADGSTSQFSFCLPGVYPTPALASLNPAAMPASGAQDQRLTMTVSGYVPGITQLDITGDALVADLSVESISGSIATVSFAPFPSASPGLGAYEIRATNPAPGGGTSNTAILLVTQQETDVTDVEVATSQDPEQQVVVSAGGDGESPPTVHAETDSGTGTVAVAVYESNPGDIPSFATGTTDPNAGTFVDVYVSPESTFSSTTIVICDPNGGDVAFWWNGSGWLPASDQAYDAQSGCITVTVASEGTSPSISDLSGTFFAAALGYPPLVTSISVTPSVLPVGGSVTATGAISDEDLGKPSGDTHAATWDWGDGTSSPGDVDGGEVTGSHEYVEPGVYTVTLTVTDSDGATATRSYHYVVVYDPAGGFVTGGGWFDSPADAYRADSSLTGKATFGFVSKYKKGASVPTGNTEFQFHAGNLNFRSTSYEWLVVAGSKAQFRGRGTINGQGDYAFFVTAIDGDSDGGKKPDKFRIRIWDRANGGLVYDNQLNAPDDADPTTVIGGGSIVVHK